MGKIKDFLLASEEEQYERRMQVLGNTCDAINNQLGDQIFAIPTATLLDMQRVLKEQAIAIEVLTHNNAALKRVLDQSTKLPGFKEPDLLVVPGVNGPRPEHAYLDRDTASSVLRAREYILRKRGALK